MINLFRHSKDYVKVLTEDEHFCFDETNFQFKAFSDGLPFNEIACEIESMMQVVKKLQGEKYIEAYFDFHVIEGLPGRLKWINGKLFYKNKYEVILYHLILFKKLYKPKFINNTIPDSFTISPTKIYHKSKIRINEF